MSTFRLTFITPLFSRGAYEDRPEIRPASIRGQFHWWFRALRGKMTDEKAIFGGVHGGATASRIVVRVSSVEGATGNASTLPHKAGGQASPKAAFAPNSRFDLHVLERLGPLTEGLRSEFGRALEAWLLLGTLGLRGTRAAGSFWWEPIPAHGEPGLQAPADFLAYEARCNELLSGAPLRFALLKESYADAEQARRVVSDTLGGPEPAKRGELTPLRDLRWPLGDVASKKERQEDQTRKIRKTSPLRFRIVGFDQKYRIAALWDSRDRMTHNNTAIDLPGIIKLLAERKPALGEQLAASALARNL